MAAQSSQLVTDPERKAQILVEAHFTNDQDVAERWGITSRTIRNYRKGLAKDAQLSTLFQLKKEHYEKEWKAEGVRFLRKALAKLEALIEKADSPDYIPKVAGAIKIVGELDVVKNALSHEAGQSGPQASATQHRS